MRIRLSRDLYVEIQDLLSIPQKPYWEEETLLPLSSKLFQAKGSYNESQKIAFTSWKKLPPPEGKTTVLAGIRQRNKEPCEAFVAHLEETTFRMMGPSEVSILTKTLTFENANSYCQSLIHHIQRIGSLQYFIQVCLDASPSVLQGMAFATVLKGMYSFYSLCETDEERRKSELFQLWRTGSF